MQKIKSQFSILFSDLKYVWLNCIVCHIPAWWIRKIFYILAGMKIGERSRIGIGTIIVRPKRIRIGKGCIVNEYCHLDGRGGLTIGNETSISIYSKIISASHNLNSEKFEFQSDNITIQDHVFLGASVIVLEGTVIKSGAVIGAGSIAKGVFESKTYYAGNPIKRLKNRKSDCEYELYHNAYFR